MEDLPLEKISQEDENRREGNGKPPWQIRAYSVIGSGFTMNLNPKWIRLTLDTPKVIRFAKWIWTEIHCETWSGSDNWIRPTWQVRLWVCSRIILQCRHALMAPHLMACLHCRHDMLRMSQTCWQQQETGERFWISVFSDLTRLSVRKSIRPVQDWVMRCWCGYLSGARCKWFAADATATPSSLASLKSRLV